MVSEIASCLLSYFPTFLLQAVNNPLLSRNNPALLSDKGGLFDSEESEQKKIRKKFRKHLVVSENSCTFVP